MATNPQMAFTQLRLQAGGSTYAPLYTQTPDMKMSLESVERKKYVFEHIMNPKIRGWLRRRAFIRSGHSSLHLEGNQLSEDEVAAVLENPAVDVSGNKDKEEVQGWHKAMQFMDAMASTPDVPITDLMIRHIHELMLGPNYRIHTPGQYRRGDIKVLHPVTRKPVYAGPNPGDVPDLMHQFGQWLSNVGPQIDPILAGGIAHLRLVEIHPFSDGNGRTARALTTLVLERGGYAFDRMVSLERYYDADKVKYCEAIGATVGETFEDGRNITRWLEYFTWTLSIEVSLVSDRMIDMQRALEWWHQELTKRGFPERHRDILAYSLINNGIRPREAMQICNMSPVTASSDLGRLVGAGLLKVEGYGRARIYRPETDMNEKIFRPQTDRKSLIQT